MLRRRPTVTEEEMPPRLEAESRQQTERVRAMLQEEGRPDLGNEKGPGAIIAHRPSDGASVKPVITWRGAHADEGTPHGKTAASQPRDLREAGRHGQRRSP